MHHNSHKFTFQTWMFILIAIFISLVYPQIGLKFENIIVYLMMILMFFSFLNINFKSLAEKMHHFKKPSIILIIIHLLSPTLVLFLKPYFIDEIFLGLIIATTVSSGISVVFLSSLFKGNPNTALLITFFSNILAPVIIPALIYIFTREVVNIDYIAISMTIIKLIIIPLLVAMLIHSFAFGKKLAVHANKVSTLMLFLVIIGIISPVRDFLFANVEVSLKVAAIIIGLTTINFFAGYFLGTTREEKITYGISANYKNYALASIIALSNFEPIVAFPAAVYALVNNLFLVPLQIFILDKDKKLHPLKFTKNKSKPTKQIKKALKKVKVKK